MGKSVMISMRPEGFTLTATNRDALFVGLGWVADVTDAVSSLLTIGVAGTFSNHGLNINATGTSRVDQVYTGFSPGSAANLVVNIADAASGWQEDAVHSDIAAVDSVWRARLSYSGSAPTIYGLRTVFSANVNTSCVIGTQTFTTNITTDSTTFYNPVCGPAFLETSPTGNDFLIRAAGTTSYYALTVPSNARTSNTIGTVVKNGSPGNQTVTIPATTTGRFSDNTHTDVFASGDTLSNSLALGTGAAQVLQLKSQSLTLTTTNGLYEIIHGRNDGVTRAASATVHYLPIAGRATTINVTTETQTSFAHTFRATVSNLRMYVSANTYAADAQFRFRKNAADGNQLVTITAGLTGWFEDVSNVDTCEAADLVNCSIAGGTSGNLTIRQFGATGQELIAGTPQRGLCLSNFGYRSAMVGY